MLPSAAGAGLASASMVVDRLVFPDVNARLAARLEPSPSPAASLLAGAGAAILEETVLRLGMQSVIAAASLRVMRRRAPAMREVKVFSTAAASLVFGAAHLPAASTLVPVDARVVARTLLLNGAGGILFGWLLWTRSLRASMAAHLSANLTLWMFS